jgi:hypothetical protein
VNERELDRNAARRLAIIRHAREVTGNVAMASGVQALPGQLLPQESWYQFVNGAAIRDGRLVHDKPHEEALGHRSHRAPDEEGRLRHDAPG